MNNDKKETVHDTIFEARDAVDEALDAACESGAWMAAVFFVSPDGNLLIHRTTNNFPQSRFLEALLLMKDNIDREVTQILEKPAKPPVLPLAPIMTDEAGATIAPEVIKLEPDGADSSDEGDQNETAVE